MPSAAPRHPLASFMPPRHPVRRLRWLAGLLGAVLALLVAALIGLVLASQALSGGRLTPGHLLIGGLGPALGLALGWLGTLPGRGGWLARWGARLATAGLPALLVVLAAPADAFLLVLAVGGGVLAAQVVDGPARLLAGPLADATHQRRAWWHAALRAARLTRRTLGPGLYRQLSRDGYIRLPSTLYPGRVYRVPRRTSPSGARVLVEEHGQVIGGLCLRPRQPLPDPEEVVAHVLLLRGDERAYLRAANFFPYDTVLTPQATGRRL
jgi:hypothetical protein